MTRRLEVVLRTCSHTSVHFEDRFIPVSKQELVWQCLKSLIVTLSAARRSGLSIHLTVVDDHSTDEFLAGVRALLARCPFAVELLALPGRGNNASMKFCYELARSKRGSLLYLVEDDYLHMSHCMPEMLEAHDYFVKKMRSLKADAEVAVMPVDNRFHYYDNTMFSSPLVMGPRRHWRVNWYSNYTLLLTHRALEANWDHWWRFSDYQLSDPSTHEDATLVPMFRRSLNLFTPVPTLAFHVASPAYEPPYSDWRSTWREIDQVWETGSARSEFEVTL